ncbi:facilitated trehalose transporter Tret1 [Diachasma alloeum]|uniref:facilitated trehalose transporter Tret1 n=1 Tax=Diachasma alloeum TaxID=454923 RepID=UPI0007382FBD|nr:facilitated trehalose transporter Tret1 [Diachasma alloeum]
MTTTSKISTSPREKVWPQWIAALIIHILSLLVGLVSGWTSPFLAKLTNGTETLTITKNEASWVASLFSITRPVGAIIAAVIVHKFGAKKAVLLNGIPHALAWACFLINESVPWIYTSRLLSGFAVGMYYSTFPLYVGEISNPKIRGALISMIAQGLAIGTLLGNLIGAYVNMMTFAIISLMMTATFFFGFLVFPDSPHYLVKENRIEAAEKSLQFYNRRVDVTAELESLKLFTGKQHKLSINESFKQLFSPINRKIVMMVNSVYIFMQLSGLYTISLYMEIILADLRVNVIAPSLIVVCVGLVGFGSGLISMYTNDRAGRRNMLAISSFGVCVTLFLLGLNHLLLDMGYDSSNVQWLSIVAIVLYQFFVCIGIIPIPSCLMSEMFPPQLKEIGTCMANVTSALFAFITSKSYQPLLEATSKEFVFWFYSLLVFAMFVYTIVVLPETKGKSLQEIQEMLMNCDKTVVKESDEIEKSNSLLDDPNNTKK